MIHDRVRRRILANSLTIQKIDAAYGAVRVIERFVERQRETVVLLGTNGNGKSTLMKCVMGIVRPRAASWSRSTASTTSQSPPSGSWARHRAGAGGPPAVSAPHGGGEPAARRLPPQGARGAEVEPGVLLRMLPAARRAPRPAGGLHERRRAADARARARADAGAAHPLDRRAVGRPGADTDQPHHRQDQGAQGPLQADRADGGAEFPAAASPTAATSSSTARSHSRANPPTSSTTTS